MHHAQDCKLQRCGHIMHMNLNSNNKWDVCICEKANFVWVPWFLKTEKQQSQHNNEMKFHHFEKNAMHWWREKRPVECVHSISDTESIFMLNDNAPPIMIPLFSFHHTLCHHLALSLSFSRSFAITPQCNFSRASNFTVLPISQDLCTHSLFIVCVWHFVCILVKLNLQSRNQKKKNTTTNQRLHGIESVQ